MSPIFIILTIPVVYTLGWFTTLTAAMYISKKRKWWTGYGNERKENCTVCACFWPLALPGLLATFIFGGLYEYIDQRTDEMVKK